MKTRDFFFEVPEELIAQEPAGRREDARLLVVDRTGGQMVHRTVGDLPDFLDQGTIVVLNDTKVVKSRLSGRRKGGGRVEVLLTRREPDNRWLALVGGAGRFRAGLEIDLPGERRCTLVQPRGRYWDVEILPEIGPSYFEAHGSVPLPPYIQRPPRKTDDERYQTVFAKNEGSAAAPTAGLHLTGALLKTLRVRGCEVATVTLHVGIDTFSPIRSERIEDHEMHGERYDVPEATASLINRGKRERRPILAVGTTTVRTLESAATDGSVAAGQGSTELYIYPGYRFKVIDSLFTNFHIPGSSLIVMVSAFAGTELIRKSYEEAIRKRYRFFSYGDAMLLR